MKFIPLRTKILGGFLTLLTAVLGASLWIVSNAQKDSIESGIRGRLELTRGVFQSFLASRQAKLSVAVDLLGRDFAFKRTIATKDPDTIASNALSLKERITAELVWVADEQGKVYADTTGSFAPGKAIADLPAVAAALEGRPATSVQLLKGVPYQLAAAPLTAPDLIGVLVAGFPIDDQVAREIKRLTLSEISFESGGRVFASTLDGRSRGRLEAALEGLPVGRISMFGEPGCRTVVLPDRLSPEVAVYIQRSWDDAVRPLKRLQWILLSIGLAAFALTTLIGFAIAEGVTAPIGRLASATRKIAEGNYRVQVEIGQRDEVGQLGKAFNRMVVGLQDKEKYRSILNKTISKEIAEELIKRGQLQLGGEEKVVTVLFSDLRDFTGISEGLTPPELVSQLNEYFTKMTRVIQEQKGVIDKYIGDAIMALFGAPIESPEDAARSLRAALAMVKALAELNAERKLKGLDPWRIGVGLNTGPAIVGNLGSENRLSYTVIGDAVNLASRLEGLTKHYSAPILVSHSTKETAQGDFLYRPMDLVRVKGKQQPVEVFELLGEKIPYPKWLMPFEAGIRAYRNGDLDAAKVFFEEVVRIHPEDYGAGEYLRRIARFSGKVPADWDPAHTMLEK